MGYKIVKERRAWWPVSWPGVTEDGAVVTNRIELRFRVHKVEEAYQLAREFDSLQLDVPEGDGGQALVSAYARLVERMADNWRGVEAENGDPLPFATENVALLMNEPGVFNAVFAAWTDCINAREEAKAGN